MLDDRARRRDTARVLWRRDAHQPRARRQRGFEPVQIQPIAVVERRRHLAHHHAGAQQAVTAGREARRRQHRLVAGPAGLESEQEQPQRRALRRDDMLCRHPAGVGDRLAQLERAGRLAVAQLEPAQALEPDEVDELAEAQVLRRALSQVEGSVDIQQRDDLVVRKASAPGARGVGWLCGHERALQTDAGIVASAGRP